ncbi:NrfD/PsrC family molybdoenzyme membrane anchor subunit [Lichenicola sp.]|uniref:NrfD/PsrC family molybdoenzyme membrane anchor subunit n=1 Tax=Lichenicola sp. TaxID=2804529 RepID=UPI003B00F6BD
MSSTYKAPELGPEDKAEIPVDSSERAMPQRPRWSGPTYYGRSQLKASPFNEWVVGAYIFLAGLSGAGMVVSTIADTLRPDSARITVRNARYMSLLAPVLGSPLLIWDLHTPQRFYNMLRIAKHTSPMSIGTWILMSFTGFAGVSAGAEMVSALLPGTRPWMNTAARIAQVPAALTGAGLGSYTATLLSATSTPFWAAAPRTLPVRFAASSIAAAASALALLEPETGMRRRLEGVAAVALATEFVAGLVADRTYEKAGVADARLSRYGRVEKIGVTGFGLVMPLGLQLVGLFTDRRTTRQLGAIASIGAITGSALLRVATIGIGDESARRPEISFRFSQPENLSAKDEGWSIREKMRRLMYAKNKR